MKYLIVLEPTETGYSAYSPDLDGCVAAGDDRDETIALMREAIAFHLEGLAADGYSVPAPQCESAYVETLNSCPSRARKMAGRLPTTNWWIYKCNSKNPPYANAHGDWQDFFDRNRTSRWGSTEWTPALIALMPGDRIIAYQTDRNELVGLATVDHWVQRGQYQDVHLQPGEVIRVKVRPLKEADPRIAAIPALQGGPIKAIYEISDSDANYFLAAARRARQNRG